jgi:hypothetical protein
VANYLWLLGIELVAGTAGAATCRMSELPS